MRKLLFFMAFIPLPLYSATVTDYKCFNDCLGRNYQYGYCQQACSYDSNPNRLYQSQQPRQRQTDYLCLSDCTNQGNNYNLCADRCAR